MSKHLGHDFFTAIWPDGKLDALSVARAFKIITTWRLLSCCVYCRDVSVILRHRRLTRMQYTKMIIFWLWSVLCDLIVVLRPNNHCLTIFWACNSILGGFSASYPYLLLPSWRLSVWDTAAYKSWNIYDKITLVRSIVQIPDYKEFRPDVTEV